MLKILNIISYVYLAYVASFIKVLFLDLWYIRWGCFGSFMIEVMQMKKQEAKRVKSVKGQKASKASKISKTYKTSEPFFSLPKLSEIRKNKKKTTKKNQGGTVLHCAQDNLGLLKSFKKYRNFENYRNFIKHLVSDEVDCETVD